MPRVRSVVRPVRSVDGPGERAGDTGLGGVVADDPVRVVEQHGAHHAGADVVGVDREVLVAEGAHQGDEGLAVLRRVPVLGRRGVGEAEARERRDDDVERVRLVSGQLLGEVEELHERARPAVDEQEGSGARPCAAQMDAVDREAVHIDAEVREAVDPLLDGPPVEPCPPVSDQLAHVVDRDAGAPPGRRLRRDVARPLEPRAEVVELLFGDVDAERLGR